MNPSTPAPPRRAQCSRCERPLRTCLCAWVRPVANRLPLLVLQHPAETRQAKGTAKLLQLSLANVQVAVGEVFDDAQLARLLHPSAALLFPTAAAAVGRAHAPPGQLVLLDGTWRQARALLRLNPRLRALPRRGLPAAALPPARYTIRRAQQPDQRSTLEAACVALSLWDPGTDTAPLIDAFGGWVQAQGAFVPSALREPEAGIE